LTEASPRIPAPAQAYVDAVNSGDLDALVLAFAPDGEVMDVDRPIRGRDAIRAWAANEVMGGRLQVLSVTAMPSGQDLLVHWAPRGSSGWRARYRFTMTGTAITLADLQYA
jgi:ketosteroid isomerase-like protein